MDKYDSYIIRTTEFLTLYYYRLLWKIYYAALQRFKIYDSSAVDSNDDEDEMDYLC